MDTDVNGQKRSSFTWIWTCATWGKPKRDKFLPKALPLSHGGFYWTMYRIVCHKWKGWKTNYIYLQFTEIVFKNGKCSMFIFSKFSRSFWKWSLIWLNKNLNKYKIGFQSEQTFQKINLYVMTSVLTDIHLNWEIYT